MAGRHRRRTTWFNKVAIFLRWMCLGILMHIVAIVSTEMWVRPALEPHLPSWEKVEEVTSSLLFEVPPPDGAARPTS